jgi:hypothetical protein
MCSFNHFDKPTTKSFPWILTEFLVAYKCKRFFMGTLEEYSKPEDNGEYIFVHKDWRNDLLS